MEAAPLCLSISVLKVVMLRKLLHLSDVAVRLLLLLVVVMRLGLVTCWLRGVRDEVLPQ